MNIASAQFLVLLSILCNAIYAQLSLPFLGALGNGQIGQLASLATGIANTATGGQFGSVSSLPAQSVPTSLAVAAQPGFGTGPLSGSGGSVLNAVETVAVADTSEQLGSAAAATALNSKVANGGGAFDLVSLANSFNSLLNSNAAVIRQPAAPEIAAPSPLTRLTPGASSNFGIPQGEGCIPLFSQIIKLMNSNCQSKADTQTWKTWGTQINNALIGGQIDLVKAARETCKLGAERQMCTVLGDQISRCDIMGSLQNAVELQRQTQRCEQVTGFADLPKQQGKPGGLLGSINNLIGGEVAGELIHNFFG